MGELRTFRKARTNLLSVVLCQSFYTDELMSRALRIRMTWVPLWESGTRQMYTWLGHAHEAEGETPCPVATPATCIREKGSLCSVISQMLYHPWRDGCCLEQWKTFSYITVLNKTLMERSFVYFFFVVVVCWLIWSKSNILFPTPTLPTSTPQRIWS